MLLNAKYPRLALFPLILCAMLMGVGAARADGDDFFLPENDGPPVLGYFGHIKDTEGNLIGGVVCFFGVEHPQAYVRSKGFPDGGYRSPDLGFYLQELGGEIDSTQIAVRCLKDGYVTARPKVPQVNSGMVPFDIVMEKKK